MFEDLISNPIGVITTLFKKRLIENGATFEFDSLIPKPYRRDKPAQRFQHNGFGSKVELKLLGHEN